MKSGIRGNKDIVEISMHNHFFRPIPNIFLKRSGSWDHRRLVSSINSLTVVMALVVIHFKYSIVSIQWNPN